MKTAGDGAYGLSSLYEKTRISNHLQMSLQRQYILLSYFKTLSVGPVWDSNPRPPHGSPSSTNWANRLAISRKNRGLWTVYSRGIVWSRVVGWIPREICRYASVFLNTERQVVSFYNTVRAKTKSKFAQISFKLSRMRKKWHHWMFKSIYLAISYTLNDLNVIS